MCVCVCVCVCVLLLFQMYVVIFISPIIFVLLMWQNTHKHWLNVYHLIQASEVCLFIPSHHALFSVLLYFMSVLSLSSQKAHLSLANLSIIQWVCDEVTVFLSSCMLSVVDGCLNSFHHRSGTSEDIRSSSCAAVEHLPRLKAIKSFVELQMNTWCWAGYSVSLSGPTAEEER